MPKVGNRNPGGRRYKGMKSATGSIALEMLVTSFLPPAVIYAGAEAVMRTQHTQLTRAHSEIRETARGGECAGECAGLLRP